MYVCVPRMSGVVQIKISILFGRVTFEQVKRRRITKVHVAATTGLMCFSFCLIWSDGVGGSRTTDALMLQTRLCVALMHDRVVLSPHVAIVMSMLGWLGVFKMVIQAKRPSRNGISGYGLVPIPLVGHMNKKPCLFLQQSESFGSASFRSCI